VRQIGEGMYTARRSQDTIGEVSAPQPLATPLQDSDRPVSAAEKMQLLERALERYQQAMLALQQQIEQLQRTHDQQARPIDTP
jgi:hypothetical protein